MTDSTPFDGELRTKLAAIEHERWADWQRYMHSLCERNDDGSLTIPAASVAHWERQIATPYAELSEREQASDMEQVDRYWHLIAAERATPMPSVEAIARTIYHHVSGGSDPDAEGWKNYSVDGDESYGDPEGKEAYLSLSRAVREAITAAQPLTVPEIPEGWRCGHITRRDDGTWHAFLLGIAHGQFRRYHVGGEGDSPISALQAAIVAATGEWE